MSAKTVFLSYRRPSGAAFARNLHQALTYQGYDVFLDTASLDAGQWESQIRTQIPQRAHFLLLLTAGVLDRSADPEDWVRREFELAMRFGRNVVPVVEDALDLTKLQADCPEAMKALFGYQAARVRYDSFEADVARLVNRFVAPSKSPTCAARGERIAPSRLRTTTEHFVGREGPLARLEVAWQDPRIHVVTLVAWGGVGKTSLVAHWAARLAQRDFDGAAYFDWSFFSQGSRTQGSACADAFVAEALRFFGDVATAESAASPWDKGSRLARLVANRRVLLVLDGLEPLQYPPSSPLAGELKDPAMEALLKGLAACNSGLCVVTTRESVRNLASWRATTAPEWNLEQLSEEAGVELLRALGVHGADKDLQEAVHEARGHALTLGLLGRFLHDAHGGDVRKRDKVRLEDADEEQGGHAFRVMEAYEGESISLASSENINRPLGRLPTAGSLITWRTPQNTGPTLRQGSSPSTRPSSTAVRRAGTKKRAQPSTVTASSGARGTMASTAPGNSAPWERIWER